MARVSRLAAVLCSLTKDINWELDQQAEQCTRIIDKVLQHQQGGDLIAEEKGLGRLNRL